MREPEPVAPAPRLDGYEWLRRLGAGGFADVHLYHQESPSRQVAVKVLRDLTDEHGRESLAREGNAMARVSGHPAIVSLYAVGSTEDRRPYLVMEYCPVAALGDEVRARPMAVARALDIMIQICGGVEMLHRSGLVHRDIKPSNIMLNSWDRPVLGDFGVAVPTGRQATGWDGFSVLWAPPEQQVAGAVAHPCQDVWALATTTWTLLAGRSPFEDPVGDNSAVAVAARVQAGRLPALGRPDAPAELEQALRAALRVDPARRTVSALEFGRALQGVQATMHLGQTPMEVRDLPADGAGRRGVDDDRTRLRPVPVLPAQVGTPDAAETRPARTPMILPAQATAESDAAPTEEPVRPARRVSAWLAVLLVAVVTAGLITAVLLQQGLTLRAAPPSQSAQPLDPIRPAPKPVASLVHRVAKQRLYWSWTHEAPQGLRYTYTIRRADQPERTESTTLNQVDAGAARGRVCIEVVAVGPDGRSSSPVSDCVALP